MHDNTIRLLLAGESRLSCDAVSTILQQEPDFYIVGASHTLDDLCFLLPCCDLLLITSPLGDHTIPEVIAAARAAAPDVKIVVSGVEEKPDVILLFIEVGADGYILQHEGVEDLLIKTRAAAEDRAIVSPELAAHLFNRVTELADKALPTAALSDKADGVNALTPREIEVLELIQDAYTNRQIAEALFIGTGTVKNHVHHILKKLDVRSRHEAAAIYELYQSRQKSAR